VDLNKDRLHETAHEGQLFQGRNERCGLGDENPELLGRSELWGAVRILTAGVWQVREASGGLGYVDFAAASGAPTTVYVSGRPRDDTVPWLVPVMTPSLTVTVGV
jgi:hypothetical protein